MDPVRLNVLISAHELNPYGGSECAEGWNVIIRLAKYHNLTIIYASGSQFNPSSYQNGIKDYFSKNPNVYNINFIPVEQTKTTLFLAKINRKLSRQKSSIGNPFIYYWGYSLWQKKAYQVAKALSQNSNFDIIHHLTSISFREPGLLWKLPIPFIWGPTGGLSRIPFQFYKLIGYGAFSKELIRNSVNKIQFISNPRIQKALKKSALIYTFSIEDQSLFYKKSGRKPKVLLDAAAYTSFKGEIIPFDNSKPISIIWCGELIKRKSLEIILYAISRDIQLKKKLLLRIVGSGPLEDYYKDLARKLSLNNCIEWIGQVNRQTVFSIMNNSDLLVHSSYREATSHVIPEALSHGLPVICHDINGMSIAIDDKCGIKIPLISPESSIEGFKNALLKLINNPIELERMKIGAKKRSEELSWDTMAETIALDYISIYNGNRKRILESNGAST